MENYKELSQNEIIDLLKEDKIDQGLIKECVARNNESINHLLNKLSKVNPQISEYYNEIVELPENAAVLYYPNKDTFDFKNLSENIIVNIPENKKRIYKTIDPTDESFYLKIRLEKVKGSLLEYKSVDQPKSFGSFLNKSYLGNALALTASLSIAMMIGGQFENKSAASVPSAAMTMSTVTPVYSLIHDSELAVKELNKLTLNKNVEELTNHDVKMILSLTEEEEEVETQMNESEILVAIEDVISPYIKEKAKVQKIAKAIFETSQSRKVDYLLFLSIMKVETTTFNQDAVSSTGDLSIAQIKPEVWTQEFNRLKKEPLDVVRLKKDPSYAIDRMGEILELQTKHKDDDPHWYGRYHSKTPSRKLNYAKKVQNEYTKMKIAQVDEVEGKVDRILIALESIHEPTSGISHLNSLMVNFDKIDSYKSELKKMKQIIITNKNKKIKRIIASL